MTKFWQSWRYRHLSLTVAGVLFSVIISRNENFHQFLLHLGNFGYLGAFFAGALFVSIFTVATGAVILFTLAKYLQPIEIALIAGFGAVLGDLIIFHLVRDGLVDEIRLLYNKFGGRHLSHLLHTKYFSWTLPVIGALIIISPLPDELGVSLMGISKLSTFGFVVTSFILNSIGIFFVISASMLI